MKTEFANLKEYIEVQNNISKHITLLKMRSIINKLKNFISNIKERLAKLRVNASEKLLYSNQISESRKRLLTEE